VFKLPPGVILSVSYTKETLDIKKESFTPYVRPAYNPVATQKVPAGGRGNASPLLVVPPYNVGDYIYSKDWDYKPGRKPNKGVICGSSSASPRVLLSCGNVSSVVAQELYKQEESATSTLKPTTEEVLLEGCVASITQIQKGQDKGKWIVNLRPKTLRVAAFCFDTPHKPTSDDKYLTTNLALYKVGNAYVNRDTWMKATEGGCFGCGKNIFLADHNIVEWWSFIEAGKETFEPMCASCQADREIIKHAEEVEGTKVVATTCLN